MLKAKVNIQVLKVDRRLITLFKPFSRVKEIKSSKISIFFEILVRIAIYGSQIDQSHGDNRLSHMIIEARAQCVDRAWILHWRKMSTHAPRHKSRGRFPAKSLA